MLSMLIFVKFGGIFSMFVICRKIGRIRCSFSCGMLEVWYFLGLRLVYITYFSVFVTHFFKFGSYWAFVTFT